MVLADLPKPIQDHILSRINKEYAHSLNSYNLTEVLGCPREIFIQRKHPEPRNLEQAWPLYRGQILDELWTPLFPKNQVRCTFRCHQIPRVIVGKYDFLNGDNNDELYDLKTIKNLYYVRSDGASSDNVSQVKFYGYNNAIDKVHLLYVDISEGDVEKVTVKMDDALDNLEVLERKAEVLYKADCTGKMPKEGAKDDPKQAWKCKRCMKKKECEESK